jgi:hypothetical protein
MKFKSSAFPFINIELPKEAPYIPNWELPAKYNAGVKKCAQAY